MRRILWFRRDLRVHDNPLLSLEGEVLPIFIFDSVLLNKLKNNDRRVTFIYNAVITLKNDLRKIGRDLALFYGDPEDIFRHLIGQNGFDEVCASGDYDSYARERDRTVSHLLPFNYLHDTYIFAPDEVLKSDGTPYLVFTPYYNRAKALFRPEHMREYQPSEQRLISFDYDSLHAVDHDRESSHPIALSSIGFEHQILTPHQLLSPMEKLDGFEMMLARYSDQRDIMAQEATSGLSTDLRFGTLSIRTLLRWLSTQKKQGIDTEPFFRQLVFRDFYAMLLHHFPHLAWQNFRYPFQGIENTEYYKAFCTAKTGVPLVDAGVRQLLQTGEMHNRVRMVCASFFTKNLLLPWQWGERFFAEHLMDYDAANNILSWQWSAGTGVDPQPYFRIFNPYAQTKKFDPDGLYIKRYLPELSGCSPKNFYDETKLEDFPVDLYPRAVVSYRESSKKALEYFKDSLK